jgi:uncharacterized membrane protein
MEELIAIIRANLNQFGEITELILNFISLLLIVAGIVISIARSIKKRRELPGKYPMHLFFRILFGGWLVVALEILLAADIVATIVMPTKEHLIELGAIALIRTFLNYFLGKELKEETELAKEEIEKPDKNNRTLSE